MGLLVKQMVFESPEFNQANLLEPEYLIDIFTNTLKELEEEQVEGNLIPENQEMIIELLDTLDHDEIATVEVEKFFEIFFLLIQKAPYILDAKILMEKFESALESFHRLVFIVKESNYSDKENLLEFIEEYGLTIENRLLAIKNEQNFINVHLPQCINKSLEIDLKNSTLILISQDVPGPLIGMTDLLNYQIKQIIGINKLIYGGIEKEMEEHKLEKILIKPAELISKEAMEEFTIQLENDKTDLKIIQSKNIISYEDLELINDIAAELATNLIYRLYWSKPEECVVFN